MKRRSMLGHKVRLFEGRVFRSDREANRVCPVPRSAKIAFIKKMLAAQVRLPDHIVV